jgi:hypothetical protein
VTGAGDREAVVGAGDGDREAVTAAGMGKRWWSHICIHKIHFNEYFNANRLTSGKSVRNIHLDEYRCYRFRGAAAAGGIVY